VPDSVNPVNWYRDAMGLSEDDPSDDTRNTGNLAAGSTRDYPNLATVPPTPTRALSTAEREALTQRLISDRANAKYIDDQLRGGPSAAVAPPPRPSAPAPSVTASAVPAAAIPNPPVPAAPTPAAEASGSLLGEPVSAAPTPVPASTAGSAGASPPAAVASAAPTPSPTSRPPAPAASSPDGGRSAPWVSLTAPAPSAAQQQPAAQPPAASPATADAAALPRESPLISPTVRSLPEPETPRAAPPSPSLSQAGGQNAAAQGTGAGTQLAARTPAGGRSAAVPAAGAPVAQVTFADNSARLSPSDRRIVDEVIPLQRQTGAAFRVVGYASRGGGNASQQLASFRIALDRANAVASVLAQAGIAPDQILVETAPPTGESGIAANRAEIFLEN
jgi:outer membrane protein OmpA-like peptidoglycan-associated protein